MTRIVIIGAGLAGLSCGLLLNKYGFEVIMVEKKDFPHHKVCGEYVSNEVLPFLQSLGIDVFELNPSRITQLQLSTVSGKRFSAPLPLGGFGLSRYQFDYLLYQQAIGQGIQILTQTQVMQVEFDENQFQLRLSGNRTLAVDLVIAAYGKRSNLDQKLKRRFFYNRSPFMGVKYHVKLDQPTHLIRMHSFRGGYCGICKVENDTYNLCYLVQNKYLKHHGTVTAMEEVLLWQNKLLKQAFAEAEFVNEKPHVINEISFEQKTLVENHILFCGDAAGMISPLCGNGMAMAIHSGKILGELIIQQCRTELNLQNRLELEFQYITKWQKTFGLRLKAGRFAQSTFMKPAGSHLALAAFNSFPALAKTIINKTHGRPF